MSPWLGLRLARPKPLRIVLPDRPQLFRCRLWRRLHIGRDLYIPAGVLLHILHRNARMERGNKRFARLTIEAQNALAGDDS